MRFGSRKSAAILPVATVTTIALGMLALTSCEGSGSHVDGPKGASAFASYIAIGTGLSMGVQSGGVLYESQVEAWPALLAHAAGAGFAFVVTDTVVNGISRFALPMLRAPGCQPPLVAPLQIGRRTCPASAPRPSTPAARERSSASAPPLNNLALPGATAWAALNLTPRIVLNSTASYGAGDRARYPLVLGSTQSQVTAMRIEGRVDRLGGTRPQRKCSAPRRAACWWPRRRTRRRRRTRTYQLPCSRRCSARSPTA